MLIYATEKKVRSTLSYPPGINFAEQQLIPLMSSSCCPDS